MNHPADPNTAIDVRLKLSAFWIATTLCYVYGDLFGFFRRDMLGDITGGRAGVIGTQYGLLAAACSVALPSVMVIACLVLARAINRWANVVLGSAYTLFTLVTLPGAWYYYIFLGVVEMMLTSSIVWQAWLWRKQALL